MNKVPPSSHTTGMWPSSTFRAFAVSEIGNDGNANWSALTVGDFNVDGRAASAWG